MLGIRLNTFSKSHSTIAPSKYTSSTGSNLFAAAGAIDLHVHVDLKADNQHM